jgi:signal transduction histidine kinase
LFYVVLTPVYVQTSTDPILLNVLCAGFRIDAVVAAQLKQLGPRSDFAFLARGAIFASTLDHALSQSLSQTSSAAGFIVSQQPLRDIAGLPVAELYIVRSYRNELQSLNKLRRTMGLAWLLTIASALLLSSYATTQLLKPIKLLDQATAEVASGNYLYRVPVIGNDELARLSATFNQMCQSIEQAQADLVRQEQIHTIGRLGSSLVHDLRNPLAAIYGGAELLVDGQLPPENTRRVAMNIHRACERVQELLRDLVNASRGRGGELDFFRLLEIVEAATEAVDSQTSGVHVSVQIDEAIEVFGERSRLERVFSNLLSNAVEAMPAGGTVSLRSAPLDNGIGVYVEDSGPGISPEMQPELFRPFVTGKRSGLGLGLALSRQTMLDFGGDLTAKAPLNGSGACFCVYFSKIRQPAPA